MSLKWFYEKNDNIFTFMSEVEHFKMEVYRDSFVFRASQQLIR